MPKIIPNNPLTTFLQVKNCNVTRQSVSLFDPDEMAIKVGSVYIWYESLIILYSFSCPARQFSHQTRVRTPARPHPWLPSPACKPRLRRGTVLFAGRHYRQFLPEMDMIMQIFFVNYL